MLEEYFINQTNWWQCYRLKLKIKHCKNSVYKVTIQVYNHISLILNNVVDYVLIEIS